MCDALDIYNGSLRNFPFNFEYHLVMNNYFYLKKCWTLIFKWSLLEGNVLNATTDLVYFTVNMKNRKTRKISCCNAMPKDFLC